MRLSLLLSLVAVGTMAFGQGLQQASSFSGSIGRATISLADGASVSYGPIIPYSNTTNPLGYYFPGYSYGDDLVMTQPGLVNGFQFGYYDPSGGPALTQLTVTFHDLAFGLLATYNLGGLPGDGAWIMTVNLAGGFEFSSPSNQLLMSLWFSQSNSPEAGWLLYDPPTIGSSQDMFYIWELGGWYWFGGNPKANFCAEIAMVPEPGTMAALGAGLLGLLALRRRK